MQQTKVTPHFFFLSLGVLATLIASVAAFLNLSFETLNIVFPDVLTDSYRYGYYNYSYEGMRSALAVLIIVFPAFLILQRLWLSATEKTLSHWDEVLRRWAVYLVLFLAAITIVVDLVTLVRYFVSGEITTRFLLKVLVVLIIAALSGWYYIRELCRNLPKKDKGNVLFAIGSGVLVIALIVWSFSIMGNPRTQRDLRLDQRRIDDLQSIQWQVINYWQQKEKIPEALAVLADPISSYMVPQDPEWKEGRVYEYRKISDMSFELCATFTEPMPKGWIPGMSGGDMYAVAEPAMMSARPVFTGGASEGWDHEKGRTCFLRTIDPDIYPPFPKPVR